MSTSYYLTNNDKYKEYLAFQEFWENTLLPGIKDDIEKYCASAEGEYVNSDTAEDVLEDLKQHLPFCPLSLEDCSKRIGAFSVHDGFFWDSYIRFEGNLISSVEDLMRFLENNPEYVLQDECCETINLEEFCKRTKQVLPSGKHRQSY